MEILPDENGILPSGEYTSFSVNGSTVLFFAKPLGNRKLASETLIQARLRKGTRSIVENKDEREVLVGPGHEMRVIEHHKDVAVDKSLVKNCHVVNVVKIQ